MYSTTYQINQIVRVKIFAKNDMPSHWVGKMPSLMNKIVTINKIDNYGLVIHGLVFWWDNNDLEKVNTNVRNNL